MNSKLILTAFLTMVFPGVLPPLTLSISTKQQSVRVGDEVLISTKLTNVSDHALAFFDTARDCDYSVDVHYGNGEQVPQTEYLRQLKCTDALTGGKRKLVRLGINESLEGQIILSRFYEFTRPGHYTVVVSRNIPKEVSEKPIESNILIIDLAK